MLRLAMLMYVLAAAASCASRTVPNARDVRRPPEIGYRIAMPDPTSHLYEVQIDIAGLRDDTIKLQHPVWSPGRYARMDFARNVQEFRASTPGGEPLKWDKENGSLWRVYPQGSRAIRIRYRVFADSLSGTFSVLDTAHANWNGPSIFMYVVGHKADPVRFTVVPPRGWHVINGASTRTDQLEFHFPNYDLLVDTPTEIAQAFHVDTFRADGRLYRVVVHHSGSQSGERARFVRDIAKIVRYQNRVVAPPPLQTYTFLFNIGYEGNDGMEHLYSTQIMEPDPWTDTATVLPGIGTAAHEYFHTWNVKRIRPAALGPFDYTREQYQPSLWVAEGWTTYYGEMTLHRAGIIDRASLYRNLGRIIRYNSETPGRKELSARMSSFHAPFWDGANPPMPTNRQHAWISYYLKGAALAMLLDLQIRGRTNSARSLDHVLRLLKERTWDAPSTSYYLQGRGYSEADVERAASDIVGANLHEWFERYVGGVEDLPWSETLALAGLKVTVHGDGPENEYLNRGKFRHDQPAAAGTQGVAHRQSHAPTVTSAARRALILWHSATWHSGGH